MTMRFWLRLLQAENKRAWRGFPKMMIQAIVLALVAGAIAFCATKMLYSGKPVEIRAAVVMEEENPLTEFAYEYVKKAEKGITFVKCGKEEAERGLKTGEFAAVILVNEDPIEGILSGRNPSVTVICSGEPDGAGAFFKELTQAGAEMLSVAQAEIYAAYELAGELEVTEGLTDLQNRINRDNLEMALGRGSLFHYKQVSATGSLSIQDYYFASAVTALLLFMGLPMGMFLKRDGPASPGQYKRAGVGEGGQQAARWLTVFGIYGAVALAGAAAVFFTGRFSLRFMEVWAVAGSMAAFILMVYEAVEKKSGAVLLLTFLTVMLLFLSGGIIPQVFFPKEIRHIAAFLPSTYWIQGIGNAVLGESVKREAAISIFYGAGFFIMSVYFRSRRSGSSRK